jgi:hypothetical protein
VSAVELVTGVVLVFFAIGIAVGVIGVIALGAVRGRKSGSGARRTHAGQGDDGPPRWPGR